MIASRARPLPEVELAEQIDALCKADRIHFSARWGLRVATVSFILDALILFGARVNLQQAPYWWLVIPPALCTLLLVLASLLRRSQPLELARKADHMLGLQERLTTAVELRDARPTRPFAELQLDDTLNQLRSRRPAQAFPIHVGRFELGSLALAIAALVLLLMLPLPQPLPSNSRAVQETIKQEAERMTALADAIQNDTGEQDAALNTAIAKALRDAGTALDRAPQSAESAVATLSEAEQKLARQQNLRAEDVRQALARVAQALKSDPTTSDVGSNLAEGNAQSAADALKGLAGKTGAMSDAQRLAASQALQAAASGAARTDPKLGESLRQAGDALAAGGAKAQGALDHAATDMQQAAQESASQAAVEKALAQLERSRSAIGSAAQATATERDAQDSAGNPSESGQQASADKPTARGNDAGAQGQGDQTGDSGGSGAGKGSLGRTTNSFDPNAANSHQELVPSTQFDRPSVSDSERIGLPDRGESGVDYREVYAEYRDRATAATQDRYIPMDLKELVKGYFSALDPSR